MVGLVVTHILYQEKNVSILGSLSRTLLYPTRFLFCFVVVVVAEVFVFVYVFFWWRHKVCWSRFNHVNCHAIL